MSDDTELKPTADAGPVDQRVRPLLDDWAEAAGHGWHDTPYGPETDCTVLRKDLEQLAQAAKAQERASNEQAMSIALADAQMVNDRLRQALRDAEAGLVFAGADQLVQEGDFVPTPLLALRAVRSALEA